MPKSAKKKITNPVDNLHLSENLTLQELRQRRRIRLKDLVQKVHHSNLETCECTSTILQLQRPDDKQTTWAAEEDSNKKTGWIKMTNIWDDDSSTTQQKANIQFQPCTKKKWHKYCVFVTTDFTEQCTAASIRENSIGNGGRPPSAGALPKFLAWFCKAKP